MKIKLNSLVLSILFVLTGCTEKLKDDFIAGVRFSPENIKIQQFEIKTRDNQADTVINLNGEGKDRLKIKYETVSTAEEAKKIMVQKSEDIKLMFAPQKVPYFGQITQSTSCTEAVEVNQAIVENDKELSVYFNLTATERFIYGSCIADQELYKSQYLMLYCKKSKKLYDIKFFYTKDVPYVKQIASCS